MQLAKKGVHLSICRLNHHIKNTHKHKDCSLSLILLYLCDTTRFTLGGVSCANDMDRYTSQCIRSLWLPCTI